MRIVASFLPPCSFRSFISSGLPVSFAPPIRQPSVSIMRYLVASSVSLSKSSKRASSALAASLSIAVSFSIVVIHMLREPLFAYHDWFFTRRGEFLHRRLVQFHAVARPFGRIEKAVLVARHFHRQVVL